ncbi:PP2C family protein-serine/threonine phosphatase, partial [Sulfobacillus harzensis]
MPLPADADWSAWLESGVMSAHRAVESLAIPGEATPPGTTLLWAVARGDTCWIAHIGDSRAYLVRAGRVGPLTVDMTPAGERVRNGREPWEHQNTAPDGHLLQSCIGQAPLMVETFAVEWQTGDVLVLTSDGLNDVRLAWWPHLIREARDVHQILHAARWRDNATLVLVRHA